MEDLEKEIRDAYVSFVSENKKRPDSVRHFMASIDKDESIFFRYYHSFSELDQIVWKEYFDSTRQRMETEEVYQEYSVREKMLSFCYTLMEVLKHDRAYVVFSFKNAENKVFTPKFLDFFEKNFKMLAQEFLAEGMDSGEIASRPILSEQYDKMLWTQTLFILRFWANDNSPEFEKTDAAVEKGVNFVFDIMARGVFDSAFDLGKFLIMGK